MRVEQQIRLLALLSLFSIGICVPAVCFACHGADGKSSYSEVRECEQRESLQHVEPGSALPSLDAFSLSVSRFVERMHARDILEPEQAHHYAVGSRAPPA